MQFGFGSGLMWGTPLLDASGNTISNPTPVLFGVLQEGGLDISGDIKSLYGQSQYPVAVGRGKGKISGSAKFAQIQADLFNTVFFGQTLTTGLITARYDTAGTTVAASVTPTPPNSGTWSRDLGVISSTGVPFKRVASAPAINQYSVSAGVYTFNATDAGRTVFINFEYTNTVAQVAGSQKQTMVNLPMGYAPSVSIDLFMSFQGKTLKVRAYNAVFSKLSLSTKQDDFVVPDCSFECFADAAGNVLDWSTTE